MWTRQLLGWTLLLTACILPNPHVESFIMELKNLAKLSRQLKGGQERNAHNQQVNTVHYCQVPKRLVCHFTEKIRPNLKKFCICVILFFLPIQSKN
jgi:hypothetical protein